MRILEVSRYKNNFADNQLPFVTEQAPIGIRIEDAMLKRIERMVNLK